MCCGTFSKQDAHAIIAAYPSKIAVIPAINTMHLLVSLSRDIDIDTKHIYVHQECGVFS